MRVFEIPGVASGFETLSTGTAIGFTSAKILPTTGNFAGQRARAVLISAEGDVRFTIDGTTPTTTATTAVGHLLEDGSSWGVCGEQNVANFRCINAVAASGAKVKCTFFF